MDRFLVEADSGISSASGAIGDSFLRPRKGRSSIRSQRHRNRRMTVRRLCRFVNHAPPRRNVITYVHRGLREPGSAFAMSMTDVFRTHHPRTAPRGCMVTTDRRHSADWNNQPQSTQRGRFCAGLFYPCSGEAARHRSNGSDSSAFIQTP